jgi:hypothetical protein
VWLAVSLVQLGLATIAPITEARHAALDITVAARQVAAELSAASGQRVPSERDCVLCEYLSTYVVEPPATVALGIAPTYAASTVEPVRRGALAPAGPGYQPRAPPETG